MRIEEAHKIIGNGFSECGFIFSSPLGARCGRSRRIFGFGTCIMYGLGDLNVVFVHLLEPFCIKVQCVCMGFII